MLGNLELFLGKAQKLIYYYRGTTHGGRNSFKVLFVIGFVVG
jgi:hypothetical protein